MPHPALISVDWGTTSLRCLLIANDGTITERASSGAGINPKPLVGFETILQDKIGPWLQKFGPLPIVLSGMIGSRQGWIEVPYLRCPCTVANLASNLHRINAAELGPIHIVPGLSLVSEDTPPEVMRGEESQIFGACATAPSNQSGSQLFVLPGTHSKWATTAIGTISSFATYMTGEMFAALRHHTILGRLMPEGASAFDQAAFQRGVRDGGADGHPGTLLNRLFATRTLGLFERLPASGLESYLSGLLIGAEIAAATVGTKVPPGTPITIIGDATLITRYQFAITSLGLTAHVAPADCAARGHLVIARTAGLLESAP